MVSPTYYLLLALSSSHSKYITAVPVVVTQWRCLLTSHVSHQITISPHIYTISTQYLHSREQQSVTAYPGPVCGDGEAPPGLGSLLTVCRLRAQTLDIYTLSTISTISTQDRRRKGSSPRTAAPHSSSNFSMKFNFSSEMWRRFHWVVVNTFSLFFLAPSQECCLLRYFLWRDKLIRII